MSEKITFEILWPKLNPAENYFVKWDCILQWLDKHFFPILKGNGMPNIFQDARGKNNKFLLLINAILL